MLNIVVEESEKKGLSLNGLKTETLVISRKDINPTGSINISGNPLKEANKLKYLGTFQHR